MDSLQRKMPFSVDAEQSVLGSVLINPNCFNDIAQLINMDDFYVEEHKKIFEVMLDFNIKNKVLDLVTLINELVSRGIYADDAQARAYIRIILGTRCKNPYLANNQIDIFSKSSKYARTFEIEDAECDRGLCLKSSFECLTERELREGLSEVLELFLDEEFTDSLRPFSHYFND